MNNEPESPPITGPAQLCVWKLETQPLAIAFEIVGGPTYRLPLSPALAQSLALAFLSQPEVGYSMLPEVQENILETAAEHFARDSEFLRQVGVVA